MESSHSEKLNPPLSEPGDMLASVRQNLLPSVAVFLVALPLCMGIAIASGVPVAAGLITGIVGGLVVGFLAGAPLQVSGPAAGLTVVVYGIVEKFGLESLGPIVLAAGLMQVLAGLFGLGQWFRAVSPAVIKGMLAGIGLLILASQFHVMIDDKPKENGIQNLVTIPQAVMKGIGWPEPSTAAERAARTQLLKDVGMLHEQQSEVADAVVALAPRPAKQSSGETKSDAQDSAPTAEQPTTDFGTLAERQARLNADLEQLQTRVDALQVSSEQHTKARNAAAEALTANRHALAQLEAGHGIAAVEAQHAAAAKLQTLLNRLKDHQWAAKVGVATIIILLAWNALARGRLRMVPAPLIAVTAVTAAAFYWGMPVLYVEVPDNLVNSIRWPSLNVFSGDVWGMLQAAAVIAIVASAETLLCATAVDQMHSGKRTNYDRELFAQGVGNTICGSLGALPMTGVIVRSAANIQAGATSRASAIMHGIWLLVFVSALGFVLRAIPVASLAAVLVYTGYKLLNPKQLKELYKYGWGEVAIFLATSISIVVTDLLTGVIIGVVLSAVKLLYTFSHFTAHLEMDEAEARSVLSLEGTATFLRLPVLAKTLESVPANAELHVELDRLNYIDHACLDLIMNWAKQHESVGGRLIIDWNSLHAQFRPDAVRLNKSVA